MPQRAAPNAETDADGLEAATDQAIAACGGDAGATVKALIAENKRLIASISKGYARGRFEVAPRGRND